MMKLEDVKPKLQEGLGVLKDLPLAAKAVAATAGLLTSSAIMASVFESFVRSRESERFPMKGRLVECKQGSIHVVHIPGPKDGDAANRPVVILDAGVGCWSLVYKPLVEDLAAVADVVVFDRFGYGHSGFVRDGGNRVAEQTENLKTVLKTLGIEGQIIYVCHSISGAFGSHFAMQNMSRIAGMIYVDAMNNRSAKLMASLLPASRISRAGRTNIGVKALSSLGILRLLTYMGKLPTVAAYSRELLPELVMTTTKWQWFTSFKMDYRGVLEAYGLVKDQEGEAFINETDGWLGDIPVTCIVPDYYLVQAATANLPRETIAEALEAQKAALKFSSDAKLTSVEDCSHWVMWDRPTIIVDAVNEMLTRCKTKIAQPASA